MPSPSYANLTIAPNGRVVIPSGMRAALGIPDGGRVVARLVDGAVVLEPIALAVRRAQDYVRSFVPEGLSLADEVIAERRAAADHE
ncbi:MAG: AbrB/MazE/SpoVT family DNA-binding domain-containing protein [Niveispirillum sp.]|nr:AbrB/MazE/SpoVT family DNA-binding domain-containing protein [Niveispirillum sp.]